MTDFKRIPPEQAQTMRSSGAVIVDIRDPHSYATLHVAGAQRVDNQNIHDFIAALPGLRPSRSAPGRSGRHRLPAAARP